MTLLLFFFATLIFIFINPRNSYDGPRKFFSNEIEFF